MTDDFKNPLKVEAGRKGGTATRQKYGDGQLAEWGKLGGRPRDKGYTEIRQQQRQEQNNNKEVMGPPGGNLRMLKTLYKLNQRSTDGETEQAGLADETPQEQVPAGKEAR